MVHADSLPVVAILAGGLATRMRPMTETVPKALLEVAGEPFIAHQLRLLARNGVTRAVICVGYLGGQVEAFVGTGAQFGLGAQFCYDGNKLLGTGGALRRALPLMGESFFVLYGDSYLDISMASVWECFRSCGRPALMTVFKNEGRWDTSNAVYDGKNVLLYDKRQPRADMSYIDFGLGILCPQALNDWEEGEAFDLAETYNSLSIAGQLAGWESPQRFYEIGTREGLTDTDRYLRQIIK